MARLVICKYIDWIGLPLPPTPINVTPRLRPTFLLFQTRSLGGKKKKSSRSPRVIATPPDNPTIRNFDFEKPVRKIGEKNINRRERHLEGQIISRELFNFYEHDRNDEELLITRSPLHSPPSPLPPLPPESYATFSFVPRLTTFPGKRSHAEVKTSVCRHAYEHYRFLKLWQWVKEG